MRRLPRLAALVLLSAVPAAAETAEERGRALWTGGTWAGQAVTAAIGEGGIAVPARLVPCAGCHGEHGRGKEEGGVRVPALTWHALTGPPGRLRLDGSRRTPYDDETLARAVRDGVDSDGRALDPAMPRYRLGPEQLAELVAFLKVLDQQSDPGLSEDAVTLAMALPPGPVGQALRRVAEAWAAGTLVHGRRPRLLFAEGAEALRRIVAETPVFAVVGGLADAALAGRGDLPVVAPLSEAAPAAGPRLFRLLPGPQERADALRRLAESRPDGAAAVLVDGDTDLEALSRRLAALKRKPLLLLADRAAMAAAARLPGRKLMAVPSSPADLAPAGVADLMRAAGSIPDGAAGPLAETAGALALLREALSRTGRHLTRARLVAALEGIRDLRTGFVPPLSYSPIRRRGSDGVYVVELDEQGRPTGPPRWQTIP